MAKEDKPKRTPEEQEAIRKKRAERIKQWYDRWKKEGGQEDKKVDKG